MMRNAEDSPPDDREEQLLKRYFYEHQAQQDQDRRPEIESFVKNELKEERARKNEKAVTSREKKVDVGDRLYAIGKLYDQKKKILRDR